jgi:hypothetical protein
VLIDDIDYALSGKSIQDAMLDHHTRSCSAAKGVPSSIRWGAHRVQTADRVVVPTAGTLQLTFHSGRYSPKQGVDLKCESGHVVLVDGTCVPHLRSYYEAELADELEYRYVSKPGVLRLWNTYQVERAGSLIDEYWTGNAGFVKESTGEMEWTYRCSMRDDPTPTFDALVFSLRVRAT